MKRLLLIAIVLQLAGCGKPSPLTAEKAEAVVRARIFATEPVYAEVPQKVTFGPRSPKDDFDGKSVATLENLKQAGLVTVVETHDPDGTSTYQAKVTEKGFKILGTMPSYRGPVYRARICDKRFDGLKNFVRHPSNPTVGSGEIVWHYENPTPLYPLFETKINKPLKTPFVSLASFYWKKHAWHFDIMVKKSSPTA